MRRSLSLTVLVFLLGACTFPVSRSDPTVSLVLDPEPAPPEVQGVAAALEPAGDCDALLEYFIEQGVDQVGPYGLGGGGYVIMEDVAVTAAADGAESSAGGSAEPSSTNVQVEGVDEGDFVKAVGDSLFVLSQGRLRVLDISEGGADEVGFLKLPDSWGVGQMLIEGDRLVIVGQGTAEVERAMTIAPVFGGLTGITLVDVSDRTNPQVVRRLTLDGSTVTTRLVEGHLRVVIEAHPVGLEWAQPEGSGLRAERVAIERNREIIRNSSIENWLPWYVSDDGSEGMLLDCADVLVPPEPSGLSTLSILDFDVSSGIENWEATSVVASGATVYANTERTYVATQRWWNPAAIDDQALFEGHKTRIHRFDTPVDGDLKYVASGDVDGFLLNQFAMDEHEDHLRVASTSAPSWWGDGGESVSQVTVLGTEGNRLTEVGRVGGLGETETIHAVRFMGPVGYVVTFRQTDPLYVIDLSDPANPQGVGELKIPGFSAYLHPVDEGLLLGVGQDADPETARTRGLQISLFDISDPTAPDRVATFSPPFGDGDQTDIWSPVQGDHKAFTLAGDRAYVPFSGWSWIERSGTEKVISGIVEVDWSDGSLDGSRVLTLTEDKDEWHRHAERVVVKGETAYAVSQAGVTTIDLSSGEVVDSLGF